MSRDEALLDMLVSDMRRKLIEQQAAMRQALEALESMNQLPGQFTAKRVNEGITALRAALEQEQA